MSDDDSRYHRQRKERLEHPNRKDKLKPYHDTTRPYLEVATQIESAIAEFKGGRCGECGGSRHADSCSQHPDNVKS